jgi:hypothetical protein
LPVKRRNLYCRPFFRAPDFQTALAAVCGGLFRISKVSHTLWRLDLAVNWERWREGDDKAYRLFMVNIGQKWSKKRLYFLVESVQLT